MGRPYGDAPPVPATVGPSGQSGPLRPVGNLDNPTDHQTQKLDWIAMTDPICTGPIF